MITILEDKPTKSDKHFEENKFSDGYHQLSLDCCPKLINTYNFGHKSANKRQIKYKNGQYCAMRLFIFKVATTFCQFFVHDTTVSIFSMM
jgi:hypothetical protein